MAGGDEAKPRARPGRLVGYCCVTRAHWKRPVGPAQAATTLTIHRDEWAFCPHDAMADGHDWSRTGGISVEHLRRMVRRGAPGEFPTA
jgi:hypothetical protein